MTTPNEREALLPGYVLTAIKSMEPHHQTTVLDYIAALTREQREGELFDSSVPNAPFGWVRDGVASDYLLPFTVSAGIAEEWKAQGYRVLTLYSLPHRKPQPESPSEQREGVQLVDEFPTATSLRLSQPQHEAPGAVVVSWSDYWQRRGETALSHDYAAFERADEWRRANTPPAPVDVRGRGKVFVFAGTAKQANDWIRANEIDDAVYLDSRQRIAGIRPGMPFVKIGTWYERRDAEEISRALAERQAVELALLSGQPAGVDRG